MKPLLLLVLLTIGLLEVINVKCGDDDDGGSPPSISGAQIVEDLISIPPKRFLLLAGVLQPVGRFLVIVSGRTDYSSPRNITEAVLFNQSLSGMLTAGNQDASASPKSILDDSGVLLDSVYPKLISLYTHEPMAMLCLSPTTSCYLFLMSASDQMLLFDLLAPSKPPITCKVDDKNGWHRVAGGYSILSSDTPNEYFAYQAWLDDDPELPFDGSLSHTQLTFDLKADSDPSDLCLASEKGHQRTVRRDMCRSIAPPINDATTSTSTSTSTTAKDDDDDQDDQVPQKERHFSYEEGACKSSHARFGFNALTGFVNGDAIYLFLLDNGRILSLPKRGFSLTGDLLAMNFINDSIFWRGWKPAPVAVPLPPPRPKTTPHPNPVVTGNGSDSSASTSAGRGSDSSTRSYVTLYYIIGGLLIVLLLVALALVLCHCISAKSTEAETGKSKKKGKKKGDKKKKKKVAGETTSSKPAPSKVGSSAAASSSSSAAPAASSSIAPSKNSSSKMGVSSSAKLSKASSAVGVGGQSSSIAASSVSSAFASKASKAPKLIKGGKGGGSKSSMAAAASSTSSAVAGKSKMK